MVTPDVCPFAAYLGERFGCTHIIGIGCRTAKQLVQLYPQFEVIGVDSDANLEPCRKHYGFGTWIEWDLEQPGTILLPEDILKHAIIVCADVIEHLADPTHLLNNLRSLLDHAPVCILTTPERDLARSEDDLGPPANLSHVREWNLMELERLLFSKGFNVTFLGLTTSDDRDYEKKTILAVIEKNTLTNNAFHKALAGDIPSDFRVVAILTAYNEEDIIVPSIRRLIAQGINVYLIDNWSTDATYDLAKQFQGQGLIGIERFLKDGPSPYYLWRALLRRVEELAREIEADWFIHHDADEVRVSPWPWVSLRDAIYAVDREGFNCIDHTVIEFHPVDNGFAPGADIEDYFKYFKFAKHPAHFVEIKAWKNFGQQISLAESGGHEVQFEGRLIYPYKFLLKHYPIRSQMHGEKKVFRDRKPRWDPEEKAAGWHVHYDDIQEGYNFTCSPSELELFNEDRFNKTYLVERLSGIGVVKEHEQQVQQLQAAKMALEGELGRLRAEQEHLQAAKMALEGELGRLTQQVQQLLNSRSWKLTAPLRWIHSHLCVSPANFSPLLRLGRLLRWRLHWIRPVTKSQQAILLLARAFTPPGSAERYRLLRAVHRRMPLPPASKQYLVRLFLRIFPSFTSLPASDQRLLAKRYTVLAQDARATLEHYGKNLLASDIQFDINIDPLVSIIVPAYNHLPYTLTCLASIANNSEDLSYEVIVVDDHSSDDTSAIIGSIAGVRLITNEENQGFIYSCNRGAEAARGKYLVFLNNDTFVTKGWLMELMRTFKLFPMAGLVGAKLLFADSRLQEAGGIVWQDGSAWNYGYGDDPAKPQYNYTREVDYCSGACIAIPRELFWLLDGFDTTHAPGYYEDTDLAFKVKQAGYRVIYQPLSEVVHFEGISSGTDTAVGVKRYQVVNQRKFYERWKSILTHHRPNSKEPELEKERHVRKRVLVLDATIITPDQDSGSLDVFNYMRIFQELGYKITFVPDNLLYVEKYTPSLQRLGIECLYFPYVSSLRAYLTEQGGWYDAVFIARAPVIVRHIEVIRRYCPKASIIFYTVDLHFIREMREAELKGDRLLAGEAARRKVEEIGSTQCADCTIVVSPKEREILLAEDPQLQVEVIYPPRECPGTTVGFAERSGIAFVGGYQHLPNVDAVLYFIRDIFPLIQRELKDIRFYIVGSKVPPTLQRLASDDIIIIGHVENLAAYLENIRLTVASLRYGAGVKGKIIASLGHGVPVVATSMAVEGMGLRDGVEVLVADEPAAFAKAVVAAYTDKVLWHRLSKEGLKRVREIYSFEAAKQKLSKILYSQVEETMRRDWNRRAQENSRYYIATDDWQTEEMFDRSGERDVEVILKDINPFLSPDATVLEIGCGVGRLLKPLAQRFRAVYGVDISPEMIRQAQERFKGLDNVILLLNNGKDLQGLPAHHVDVVISFIVFQHIPDAEVIRNYIREVHRVLKPGGIFKFQACGRENTPEKVEQERTRVKTTWLGVRFTEGEITSMTQEAGFRVLSTYFGQSIQYLWVIAQKP